MSLTRLALPAAELAAALDAVRFAADPSAEHPAAEGVLFEAEAGTLRLVATDRYRLAVSQAAAELTGPEVSAVVPVAFVDALRPLLAGPGAVELVVDGDRLTARACGSELTGERLDVDYPDYRRLLHLEPTHRAELSVSALRERLLTGPTRNTTRTQDGVAYEVSVLTVDQDGTLTVGGDEEGGLRVQVNRAFLLDAVAAATTDQLVLELGGPIAPLAIRFPDRAETFSLLMPTAP